MSDERAKEHRSTDDDVLRKELEPLRGLRPPLDVRADVRRRVKVALRLAARPGNPRHDREPWWRRRITVPVPLAMGTAVLILALGSTIMMTHLGRAIDDSGSTHAFTASVDLEPGPIFVESALYIEGLGTILVEEVGGEGALE